MQSFNKEKFMESDVALYGMFVSVSLVLSYIEAIIPINLPVPGMKLGLANIVIIWVLYSMGIKAAAIVSLVRVLLAGFMFGNMYSIIFSMAGALLSLITMYFLKKIKAFSIIGVSIAGGVMHNAGQIIVSMIVLENVRMAYYFPALMISGVVAGIAIGLLGGILYRKIKILPQNTDRGKK
ncbi:MAG: Gx transporter family protein [Butyrivibrio sp.]